MNSSLARLAASAESRAASRFLQEPVALGVGHALADGQGDGVGYQCQRS